MPSPVLLDISEGFDVLFGARRGRPLPTTTGQHPARMMRALIAQAMAATGESDQTLAAHCGVSVGTVRQLRDGKDRSWGFRGEKRPDGVPALARTRPVCLGVGLAWPVVHLALMSQNVIGDPEREAQDPNLVTGYDRRKDRRVRGVRGDEMQTCIDHLPDLGADPEHIRSVQTHLDGPVPENSREHALGVYRDLVTATVVTALVATAEAGP